MGKVTDVTGLLLAWQGGDEAALKQLSPHIYEELHRLAGRAMSGENQGHTLQTTALVHEAYLRLTDAELALENRQHFYALAARMMRRILVDHARGKRREKRGSGVRHETLNESIALGGDSLTTIIELDDALGKLSENDPKLAEAVELIYFGGLSYEEVATELGIPRTRLFEEIKFAKAWLQAAMS